MDTDDLCKLEDLTDESVLNTLYSRFAQKNIYTNSGLVLISINPYTPLDIYGSNVMKAYFNTSIVDPHVYSVAEACYQDMICGEDQTIVISGESGSGKTENTKYIIDYLLARTVTSNKLKHKIEASNVILESFGNASTVLNKNSSRVGRKISFSFNKKISGAKIDTYLLEKSRVTHQSKDEKNFHIFYQLLAYKNLEIQNDFVDTTDTAYGKSKCQCSIDFFNDMERRMCKCETGISMSLPDVFENKPVLTYLDIRKEEYLKVLKSFKEINSIDVDYVENVLLGITYLGSVTFDTTGNDLSVVKNEYFNQVVSLLGVNADEFENILIRRDINVRSERIEVYNTVEDAITIRNSIARDIYINLFDFIVKCINESLVDGELKDGSKISILDIFGFEVFRKNSLDQLCINWTNEKIQNQFIKRIFLEKKNLYERENLPWKDISFEDNSECIEEIERPCGLMDLIDEESNNSWGTTENLAQKIRHYVKKYVTVKCNDTITVKHYASKVDYDLNEFIEKNRERSTSELSQLGLESKYKKKSSAIRSFTTSLNSLFKSINSTQIKYIRCIKPNEEMKPLVFDKSLVHKQLVATGVTETIKISRQLFPQEIDKDVFFNRFPHVDITKIGCIEGTTKIFMPCRVRQGLEASRQLINRKHHLLIKKVFLQLDYRIKEMKKNEIIRQNEAKKAKETISFEKVVSDVGSESEEVPNTVVLENTNYNQSQEEFLRTKSQAFIIEIPEEIENKIVHGDFETTDLTKMIEKARKSMKDDFEKSPQDYNKEMGDLKATKSLEYVKKDSHRLEELDHSEDFIEKSRRIRDPYERIQVLENKLLMYKKYFSKPCRHCKNLETKYRFQSEALKNNNLTIRELEKYKMKVEELETQIQRQGEDEEDIDIPPSSNLYGCVISLFLEYVPSLSNDTIPRSEVLSLAHASYKITTKINKNLEESVSAFIDEVSLRLSMFERNMQKLLYILSNLIEYQSILRSSLESPDMDDLIEVLFKHLCELQKTAILEYLPHCVTDHQHLKNFRCYESYLKRIFKPPSISKLVSLLEYFHYQMTFYYLPESYINESVNFLLKTINTSVFNSLLIKKNFLSFNRCVQINYNLNEVDKFCRGINYYEGMLNLGHSVAIIKLVNLCTTKSSADCILDQCSILNCLQIKEIINKMDDKIEYHFGEDNKTDKFLPDPIVCIPVYKECKDSNFVCPRYVPYEGLSSIFKYIK